MAYLKNIRIMVGIIGVILFLAWRTVFAGELVGQWSFNEGKGQKVSGKVGDAFLGGGDVQDDYDPKWDKVKGDNYALEFDGIDDYINLGSGGGEYDMNNSEGFTIEVKFRSKGWNTGGDRANPLVHKYNWGAHNGYLLGVRSFGEFGFSIFNRPDNPSNETYKAVIQTTDISLHQWHQAVGVLDPKQKMIYFYLDGELKAKTSIEDCLIPDTSRMNLIVGHIGWPIAEDWSYAAFNGTVDEIKIYNYARSAEEISADYKKSLIVSKANMSIHDKSTEGKMLVQKDILGEPGFKGESGKENVPVAGAETGRIAQIKEEEEVLKIPISERNLLHNGNFEIGSAYWWSPAYEIDKIIDTSVYKFGGKSLLLDNNTTNMESILLKVETDQTYTLSCFMKSNKDDMPVVISFIDAKDRNTEPNGIKKVARVGKDWQRYHITGTIDVSLNGYYAVRIAKQNVGGKLWIDGIQLEKGELTDFSVRNYTEVTSYITNSNTHLYLTGERVKLSTIICINQHAPESGKTTLTYRLIDYYDRQVKSESKEITISANGDITREYELSADTPGMYRLHTEIESEKEKNISEVTFGVVNKPKYYNEFKEDSMFGLHGHINDRTMEIARKIGAKWWRLLDFTEGTHWIHLEPQKDRWVWYDENIKKVLENKMFLLGELFQVPPWANGGRTSNYLPEDINDLKNYILKVVEHYRYGIKYWEFWNEPWGDMFWKGTPKEYAELLKWTYETIKEIGPDLKIVGGNTIVMPSVTKSWTIPIYEAGALQYMDILSYHYGEGLDVEDIWNNAEKYGGAKEVWNTEFQPFHPFFSNNPHTTFYNFIGGPDDIHLYRREDNTLVKMVARMKANNVKKAFYYSLGHDLSQTTSYRYINDQSIYLVEPEGFINSRAVVYAVLAQIIDDTDPVVSLKSLGDNVECYVYKNRITEGSLAVVWSQDIPVQQATLFLNDDENLRIFNVVGNQISKKRERNTVKIALSGEPVYLTHVENIGDILKQARVVGLVPKEFSDKFDSLGGVPERLKGTVYRKELESSAGLKIFILERGNTPVVICWNERKEKDAQLRVNLNMKKAIVSNIYGDEVDVTSQGGTSIISLDRDGSPVFIECVGYDNVKEIESSLEI